MTFPHTLSGNLERSKHPKQNIVKKSISYGKFTSWLRTYDCSVSNWPCAPLDLLRLAGGPADPFGCTAERYHRPGRTHRPWNSWGRRYGILASALTAFVTFCVSLWSLNLGCLCDWDISFGKKWVERLACGRTLNSINIKRNQALLFSN